MPFEITVQLHEQGLIDEPRSHRKSVCLTDLGLERAKAAFNALCSDQSSGVLVFEGGRARAN